MSEYPYMFMWGNNPIRKNHKGKPCKLLKTGKMNSVLIEFEDGKQMITSRRAIRKHG